MKVTIDTENKTVAVEEQVELSKLAGFFEKFLPNGEWKEYTLVPWVITDKESCPVYYYRYNYYDDNIYRPKPWYQDPIVTCGTTAGDVIHNTTTIETPNTFTVELN